MQLRSFSLVSRLTVTAALILTGTVLIFGIRSYQAGKQRAVAQWQERLSHEAGMAALKVQGFMADVARDARYLARVPSVRDYVTGDPANPVLRQRVEENFRALMLGKPVYAQVRLIGEADFCREKVRLDQANGLVTVTGEEKLQQKGDRDYIEQSRSLDPEGIFLSDMDLNQDFGRVTEPWTPMLRAVKPVMDAEGKRFGWIVINADLRPLLEGLEQQTLSGLRLALANDRGSYLLHPNPAYRFGADLGTAYNLRKPVGPEDFLIPDPWLVHTAGFDFLPDLKRRFYVRTGTDGRAALADLAGVRNQALLASALTALAGLLVLVVLARLVTRRLRQVAEALGRFETGGPAAPLPEEPADEIGQLAAAFNRMSGKIADQVRTLEEARGRADEASRAKDDFLAVMSHEIRTPLNAVTGMLHVLERNRPAPHQEPILRSLHAAASQLTSLLNEALDWSKIKAGRLVCDDLPFDPRELLSDLELTHRPLAARKGLKWSTVLPTDLPHALSGDRLRISQVLHNLLSNAVKFTDSGFVRLTAAWQENQLTVRVEDTGIGIREQDIGRIFSPFDQANGEIGRRFGGTGLGLSISRSLAELMGGRLTVESRVDDGSCFVLTLPCQTSTLPAPAANPRPADPLRRGVHVLCVEDSAMNREVMAAFLDEAGITCAMAGDGAAALRLLTDGMAFDAALLDLQLPDTNGIHLAARLHAIRPGLPLLAVTAQADEATRTACLAAGMSDVVTKPIQPRLLIDAISRALAPSKIARPAATAPLPSTASLSAPVSATVPKSAPLTVLTTAPETTPPSPLLTELFAHEPERLARVMKALAGEFSAAIPELTAAAESADLTRLRRLRHKLHSAIAGLRLTELDAAFQQLIAGNFPQTSRAIALLSAAADACAAPRGNPSAAAPNPAPNAATHTALDAASHAKPAKP